MTQKKVSVAVYAVLLILCAAALGYLAGFNHSSSDVCVTVVSTAEAMPQKPQEPQEPQEQTMPVAVEDGLIDLNTADQMQLESLPGIGPGLAARIIAYRETIGSFVSKEQIKDVAGIGDKRYTVIEQMITVGGTP